MATSANDKAPWQQTGAAAPPGPVDELGFWAGDEPGHREEPVWTGLIPAVAAADDGDRAPDDVRGHDAALALGGDVPGDEGRDAAPVPDGPAPSDDDPEVPPVPRPGGSSPASAGRGAAPGAVEERGEADEEDEQARRRAARRRDAVADEPRFPRLQQVFLAVVLPLVLLAAAVRIVATPLLLWVEYHRPGFPADPYGFSAEQRMTFGSYGLDYVLNWAPPGFLGDLVDPEGGPLFLPAEVAHMTDVKLVLQIALAAVAVLALAGALSGLYLRAKAPGAASGALFFGSWLTVVLLALLVVGAVAAWQQFFTVFHSLFFAEGTWTFRASDTLIRLYPTSFWTDAALAVGALTLLGALVVMALTWPTAFRRHRALERVRRRQELRRRLAGH